MKSWVYYGIICVDCTILVNIKWLYTVYRRTGTGVLFYTNDGIIVKLNPYVININVFLIKKTD